MLDDQGPEEINLAKQEKYIYLSVSSVAVELTDKRVHDGVKNSISEE